MLRLGAIGTFGLWIGEDVKTIGVDNMKKVIALSLLAIATGAFAQGTGFYAGAGAGESNTKFNNEDFPKDASILEAEDHDKAWKFFAGYNSNQYFGMEAGYADLGIARYVFNNSVRYKVRQSSWIAAAKINLPINEKFDVFGKLGFARNSHVKASYIVGTSITSHARTKTSTLYGVGAQYNFSEQVGIRVEYENFGNFGNRVDTRRTRVNMWSASVTFNF